MRDLSPVGRRYNVMRSCTPSARVIRMSVAKVGLRSINPDMGGSIRAVSDTARRVGPGETAAEFHAGPRLGVPAVLAKPHLEARHEPGAAHERERVAPVNTGRNVSYPPGPFMGRSDAVDGDRHGRPARLCPPGNGLRSGSTGERGESPELGLEFAT